MAQTRVGVRLRPTLWNGLLAYYTGDNTPNDILGNYNGTLLNGATYGTGIISNGFSFDGVNDYVDFGNGFPIINGDLTISFWFKGVWNGPSAGGVERMGGSGLRGLQFGPNFTNDGLIFYVAPTSTTLKSLTYLHGTSFDSNSWHHCVAVLSTSNYMRIYLNGTQVAETTTSIPTTHTQSSSLSLTFCGRNLLNGVSDEIGIWNRVLSPTEVTELYNSGSGKQYPN